MVKEKAQSAERATQKEAQAVENRMKQYAEEKYAAKADLDRVRDKLAETPTRGELITLTMLISAFFSAAWVMMLKLMGKKQP